MHYLFRKSVPLFNNSNKERVQKNNLFLVMAVLILTTNTGFDISASLIARG